MTQPSTGWPDTLTVKRRSPDFDQDTIPAALRRSHSTKEGTWAVLHILEGQLIFRDLEAGTERILGVGAHRVIYPQVEHEVELAGPVRFYVEFHVAA